MEQNSKLFCRLWALVWKIHWYLIGIPNRCSLKPEIASKLSCALGRRQICFCFQVMAEESTQDLAEEDIRSLPTTQLKYGSWKWQLWKCRPSVLLEKEMFFQKRFDGCSEWPHLLCFLCHSREWCCTAIDRWSTRWTLSFPGCGNSISASRGFSDLSFLPPRGVWLSTANKDVVDSSKAV